MLQPRLVHLLLGCLAACGCASKGESLDVCVPDDLDGVIGGQAAFVLTGDEAGFSPRILSAQNRAEVTLTLINASGSALGFFVECLKTPNDDGCPTESCFPESATIEPIAPGESQVAVFEVPLVEGTYTISSEPGVSEPRAQFVVK